MTTRSRKISRLTIVNFIVNTVLFITIIFSYYFAEPINSSKVIYVPKGSIGEIITQLSQKGFLVSGVDTFFIRVFGYPQHGWINIGDERLSRGDFLYKLMNAKAALEKITLVPGETLDFFLAELAEKLELDAQSLRRYYDEYAQYKDGVIVPETYFVPKGITERHLMYYLVNNSMEWHKEHAKKILGQFDMNQWFKYVIIASIIQKEAANKEEMPLVSAVIYNRLKIGMPLQMDGTLNYGIFSHTKVTPEMIKNDTTSYNTYKFRGLPDNPVGAAGFEAVKSAVSPAKVNYLYFVRNKNGTHSFSNSYKNHLNNINEK